MEAARTPIRDGYDLSTVKDAFDEPPFPRSPGTGAMDWARAQDRDGPCGLIKQRAFERDLPRRIGRRTGIDRWLRLRNWDRQFWKPVLRGAVACHLSSKSCQPFDRSIVERSFACQAFLQTFCRKVTIGACAPLARKTIFSVPTA